MILAQDSSLNLGDGERRAVRDVVAGAALALRHSPTLHRAHAEEQKRMDRARWSVLRVSVSKPCLPLCGYICRAIELKVRADPPQFSPIVVPVVDEQ